MTQDIRLLFLGAGPAMPNSPTPYKEKIEWLSKCFSGEIITPVSGSEHMNVKRIGNFSFYPFIYYRGNSFIRNICSFITILRKALKIYKNNKFNVIIAPNPLITGLTAIIIGIVTGARVVIEVKGNFESAFKYGDVSMGLVEKLKDIVSKKVIPFVLYHSDMARLLYADQLKPLNMKNEKNIKSTSFSDFVPIKNFLDSKKEDKKYILFLGYPWFLKGVDLLIQAFNKICLEFPEYRLKIVGWCPEGKEYFENLAKDNDKIDLCDPVYYDEVLKLMSECSLFVLPSRTEAMGRVLVEAMACKKPIIASNVGGIPVIIKDDYNGLLFEKENVDHLAEKIRLLLSDKSLAKKLAVNGNEYAQEYLSEEAYLKHFEQMIKMI